MTLLRKVANSEARCGARRSISVKCCLNPRNRISWPELAVQEPLAWRTMPHHGMTAHVSGTSLSAQARYAARTREILECWFEGRPIRNEYLIVDSGRLAGAGAHSYTVRTVAA